MIKDKIWYYFVFCSGTVFHRKEHITLGGLIIGVLFAPVLLVGFIIIWLFRLKIK